MPCLAGMSHKGRVEGSLGRRVAFEDDGPAGSPGFNDMSNGGAIQCNDDECDDHSSMAATTMPHMLPPQPRPADGAVGPTVPELPQPSAGRFLEAPPDPRAYC